MNRSTKYELCGAKRLTTILFGLLIAASTFAQREPVYTYRYFLWGGAESATKPPAGVNYIQVTFDRGNPVVYEKFKDVTVTDPSTYDVGVKIGETIWATRNVDEFGKFADNPESYGMFYQWNRPQAWASTDAVILWDNTTPTGTTWDKANDPCPKGWKVPTFEQLVELYNTTNSWVSNYERTGVAGRIFTNGVNSIFFPAAGFRSYQTGKGTLGRVGECGSYWSSTEFANYYAYLISFLDWDVSVLSDSRSGGYSVRCVKE